MSRRERSYRAADGRELLLRSERGISANGSGWRLTLELLGPGRFGRKHRRISRKVLEKSEQWSTSAIELIQAQEELDMLLEAGVEIDLLTLLRPERAVADQ